MRIFFGTSGPGTGSILPIWILQLLAYINQIIAKLCVKSCINLIIAILANKKYSLTIGEDDCDFDDESNPFCHWINSNDTLKFQRKYLWTGTAGTGPSGDHSNNNRK